MKWFGAPGGAAYETYCEHVAVPAGALCARCSEPIAPAEAGLIVPALMAPEPEWAYHYECFMRQVVGGVNHQLKLCCCQGCAGVLPPDPVGMTRREAAIAAEELHREGRLPAWTAQAWKKA